MRPLVHLRVTATREAARAAIADAAARVSADAEDARERQVLLRTATSAASLAMEAPRHAEISVDATVRADPTGGRGYTVSLVVDVDESAAPGRGGTR